MAAPRASRRHCHQSCWVQAEFIFGNSLVVISKTTSRLSWNPSQSFIDVQTLVLGALIPLVHALVVPGDSFDILYNYGGCSEASGSLESNVCCPWTTLHVALIKYHMMCLEGITSFRTCSNNIIYQNNDRDTIMTVTMCRHKTHVKTFI